MKRKMSLHSNRNKPSVESTELHGQIYTSFKPRKPFVDDNSDKAKYKYIKNIFSSDYANLKQNSFAHFFLLFFRNVWKNKFLAWICKIKKK